MLGVQHGIFTQQRSSCCIYGTVVLKNIYPLHHGVSFYPLLLSFHLQIAYIKVRNLQIGVDKLVWMDSINLFWHAKSATYVISIIMDIRNLLTVKEINTLFIVWLEHIGLFKSYSYCSTKMKYLNFKNRCGTFILSFCRF